MITPSLPPAAAEATPRPWHHGDGLVIRAAATEPTTIDGWRRATVVALVPCVPAMDDNGDFPPPEGEMPATWEEGYANARMIATAVNAHDDLVTMLARFVSAAENAPETSAPYFDSVTVHARALLARLDAEGGA